MVILLILTTHISLTIVENNAVNGGATAYSLNPSIFFFFQSCGRTIISWNQSLLNRYCHCYGPISNPYFCRKLKRYFPGNQTQISKFPEIIVEAGNEKPHKTDRKPKCLWTYILVSNIFIELILIFNTMRVLK